MANYRLTLVAGIVSILSVTSVGQSATWLRDVDHALSVAQVQQRPILLFVSMDGCTYCDRMIATTFSDGTVRRTVGSGFIPTAIKGSERPDLVRQLKIRSYPTTLLVSPDGEVLDMMVGYVDAAKFQQRLQRVPARLAAQASRTAAQPVSHASQEPAPVQAMEKRNAPR
jgi:thioredoxin-related protein